MERRAEAWTPANLISAKEERLCTEIEPPRLRPPCDQLRNSTYHAGVSGGMEANAAAHGIRRSVATPSSRYRLWKRRVPRSCRVTR